MDRAGKHKVTFPNGEVKFVARKFKVKRIKRNCRGAVSVFVPK